MNSLFWMINKLSSIFFIMCILVTLILNIGCSTIATSSNQDIIMQYPKDSTDPCWFMTLNDKSVSYETIKKRQDQEQFGYPIDTPLKEAIEILNEEKQCINSFAAYPQLTEEEVISAIVAGADDNISGDSALSRNEILWKIASQKMMPKGALLRVSSGGRVQGSPLRHNGTIQAKGIRITLMLGLDKNDPLQTSSIPEYVFIIRKNFSDIEIIR